MAFNWARLAWTISFAVLAIMVLFIYTEYSSRFSDRYGDIKVQPDTSTGFKREGRKKEGKSPPSHPSRRSRKYRRRK